MTVGMVRSCHLFGIVRNSALGSVIVETRLMGDFLTTYATVQPDKPAVIEHPPGGQAAVVTFSQLEERANRQANALLALGSGPGQKVLWCGPNSVGVVEAVNATRK